MKKNLGIHWFRRDLRVAGNPSLRYLQKHFSKNVLGIFCFDSEFLSRDDFSHNRFALFLKNLEELKNELRKLGSDLLVVDELPESYFPKLIDYLKKQNIEPSIHWCRDYEPFARARDKKIAKTLEDKNIEFKTHRDHLIIEPHELLKSDSTYYKVFTPFSRKWLEIFNSEKIQNRIKIQENAFKYLQNLSNASEVFDIKWAEILGDSPLSKDSLTEFQKKNDIHVDIDIPEGGCISAFKKLENFSDLLDEYHEKRDIPSLKATSRLAMYLKSGVITTAQIIHYLNLRAFKNKKNGQDNFLNELIWREFYYHLLYHEPRVETEEFNLKYKGLAWENNEKHFKAWKEGKTGFPIVDAGMRELNTTGWMHNRVRMIVASFLVKDLLIDWRWGEKYFMEKLLDGDLAPNNGGWQWAASTGCDAQPYFRIFNPWLQSKRFDPEGEYIKKFIPELKDTKAKELHKPILDHKVYPAPIVDHSEQRDKALDLFKQNLPNES